MPVQQKSKPGIGFYFNGLDEPSVGASPGRGDFPTMAMGFPEKEVPTRFLQKATFAYRTVKAGSPSR